jgi:hypothetical protein
LVVLTLLSQIILFSSCRKPYSACDVKNPLTNLPWLKELIDGIESDAQAGFSRHVKIYQCTYKDGIGFLIAPCVGCPDAGYSFRNCEGEVLCGGGGIDGKDTCSEFSIKNKKLIYNYKK